MLNKTFVKKVSTIALTGAVFAVSLLSFNSAASPVVATTSKLELSNSVDKDQADRGETLSYTVTVKNTGDTNLSNTFVWINTPNLANYVAGSSSYTRTSTGATNNLTDAWIADGVNFGNVPAGTNVILRYKTTVANNANPDDIVWSVAAAKSDQTPNKVQANSWTRVIFKNPGICAEKTADKSVVEVGDVVTFTIKVCNRGNVVLHDVLIGDIIESPFRYVAGSGEARIENQVTKVADTWLQTGFNAGYLNPGQSTTLTFKVTVTNELKDGQVLQNVAQIKSNETPEILKCFVVLKGKVLGITTQEPPTQLPDTGPGEMLLFASGLVPAGYLLKKFRNKI